MHPTKSSFVIYRSIIQVPTTSNKEPGEASLPKESLGYFEPDTEHTPWTPFIYSSLVRKRGMDDSELLAMHKGKLTLSLYYLVNLIGVLTND